jgi:hypothetical protein
MGVTQRPNSYVRYFWPDNTKNKIYIPENELSIIESQND